VQADFLLVLFFLKRKEVKLHRSDRMVARRVSVWKDSSPRSRSGGAGENGHV